MKKILTILLLSAVSISASRVSYQTIDTNAKIKTMFIYNFTKYVEWPSSYKQGNFVIGILGKTSLTSELKKMAATKKAVTQQFEIKEFSSIDKVAKCHILYIAKDRAGDLSKVIAKLKPYSTLVITESEGLAKKGSGINFVVMNNKQRFEINKSNIEKHNLKVSNSLLSLAITVG